ncbi:DPP IV N-terminal domain-containing protein [Kordiimonas sp.]|uniref:S9 family peptidase n=1 Tax=Kordiimonas sp. TaxID=1970157 RepID=UPI003A8D2D7F
MNKTIRERYQEAQAINQSLLSGRLVLNDAVYPHWIEDSGCFWYQRQTRDEGKGRAGNGYGEGKEFRLVDAGVGTNVPAFDHQALADALLAQSADAIEQGCDPWNLPLQHVSITLAPLEVRFEAFGGHWVFDADTGQLLEIPEDGKKTQTGVLSPDGQKTAFVRDHNLWVRDEASGEERALTEDGTEDHGYASGLMNAAAVEVVWSGDSKRLLTHQLDTRQVKSTPMVYHVPTDGSVRPQCVKQKISYPGDDAVEAYQLLAVDVDSGALQQVSQESLYLCRQEAGFFQPNVFGWWSGDHKRVFYVDVSRGAKTVRVVMFDTQTGARRQLFEECSDTFVKLNHTIVEQPVLRPLPESDELIWFSERSGWAHLYLYDLKTGACKHAITEGEWLVRDILYVDTERRELVVQTAGRDPDISPYYRDICRVHMDTGKLTPLGTGPWDYVVQHAHNLITVTRHLTGLDSAGVAGLSPDGRYLVTTRSRVDEAPVSILLDREGQTLLTLETADVSGLPSDWQWPEPVTVMAADGETELRGVLYRPPGFCPDKHYPVLDLSSGHPGYTYMSQGSFINAVSAGWYLEPLAYAALGFIVVTIEGRGTPLRHKAFQDHSYGRMASASDFNDRIAGLRQLASRYPSMDLERVGLAGCDGISGPVYGLLEHPDFYKVGVVVCLHDSRFRRANLAEMFEGLDRETSSKPQAEELADALAGKLLLIHGMRDSFTPATATLRLIDAFQSANKDVDILLLPNEGHSIPAYALRRSWDYLVTHLQGIEPPKEFRLTTGWDRLAGRVTEEEEDRCEN